MNNTTSVGFTGTQRGMTQPQVSIVNQFMLDMTDALQEQGQIFTIHHGDCIGADAQIDGLAQHLGIQIVIHPPTNQSKRANCTGVNHVIMPQKEYLTRNRDIVDESGLLLACPATQFNELRSGTWSTVRYAKKVGVPIFIIFPDGTVEVSTDFFMNFATDMTSWSQGLSDKDDE